ncbi:unnamed protein product [Parajaminaea phylloscopi]
MLLVGSPGSGKGTLSALLSSAYSVATDAGVANKTADGQTGGAASSSTAPTPASRLLTISAGDLIREHIQRRTDVGLQAAEVVRKGLLMPDEVMMEMVGKEVQSMGGQHWLLDGYPRTLGQARLLDTALAQTHRPLNLVVHLNVPESVILARILDRWVHPASGRVYNLSYNPPKESGRDDVTGEPLVQRSDDNEETFRARLRSFHDSTDPMISHFAKRSSLSVADDAGIATIPRAGAGAPAGGTSSADDDAASARVFVSLEGETSKEIWPKLQEVMYRRFGDV